MSTVQTLLRYWSSGSLACYQITWTLHSICLLDGVILRWVLSCWSRLTSALCSNRQILQKLGCSLSWDFGRDFEMKEQC